ncbi:zf-HC2 domain-containing protein [uncultured Cytophaga sp.]|uniref:zf-HC2 domain-containing protein n=1 Tax=uncultured Cytophaga sp. TaxID=160238 RepID=UPI00261492C4|nr:zf-HC2 domain-containing protein [uncultured Cytophaga sp.]
MIDFIKEVVNKLVGKKAQQRYCCKDCLCKLNLVLDGEASTAEIEHLQKHIHECAPCFDHYNIEKSVKEVIKHKLEQRPVPASLIENIRGNINKNCK